MGSRQDLLIESYLSETFKTVFLSFELDDAASINRNHIPLIFRKGYDLNRGTDCNAVAIDVALPSRLTETTEQEYKEMVNKKVGDTE